MPAPALEQVLRYMWILAILGHLCLFLLLWRTGLRSTYRFFSWYLLFRVGRAAALWLLPPLIQFVRRQPDPQFANTGYAWLWILTQPMLWFFYILVVLELYSLVLRNYKGIATLSRWALWGALCLSLVLSLLTLAPDLNSSGQRFPVLHYFGVIDRGIVSSLVLFLLLISLFLVWYPIPLNRNVVVHSAAYALYFLSMTLALLVPNLLGTGVTQTVNVVLSAITLLCLLVWILFLNRRGEETMVVVRRQWSAGDEEMLIEQLGAVNSSLLRAVRK